MRAFPVKRLKVDASFVMGIGKNRDDEKIVEAVVALIEPLILATDSGLNAQGLEGKAFIFFREQDMPAGGLEFLGLLRDINT